MNHKYQDGFDFCKILDKKDPLGKFRHTFHKKKDVIYMCGNSLGLACNEAIESLTSALETWKEEGVNLWNANKSKYYLYSNRLSDMMAHLVGADADEIAVVGSTTMNVHQTVSTFYKPTANKYKILVDDLNFPTDRYAVDSQVRLKGYEPDDAVKVVPSRDGKFMYEEDIIEGMTDDVALILLPLVYYKTAQILDMSKVTRAAQDKGIVIGWDLCHAIGAIEINLKEVDADFAIWCTYKYLNGGPGSPAALYINRKHFQKLPVMSGWYGNKKETQFLLKQQFDHQKDASGWQIGTPTVLSMATLEGSLKIFKESGIEKIRSKSLHITGYMMYLIETKLSDYGFAFGNLREDDKRGGHVCLEHDEAYRISVSLRARGVVPDFREPNVIRLTPVPLYTTYQEVYNLVEILLDIMKEETYKQVSNGFFSPGMPRHACYECTWMIRKFSKLKEKFLIAQSIFYDILKKNQHISEEDLKYTDRQALRLQTNISLHKLPCISLYEDVKRDSADSNISLDMIVEEQVVGSNVPLGKVCDVEKPLSEEKRKGKEGRKKQSKNIDGKEILKSKDNYNDILKDFVITELTFPEQVAEVEKRKSLPNYRDSPFRCDICYKGFLKLDTLNNHTIRHDPISGVIVCEVCKFRFHTRRTYLLHVARHKKKFCCITCNFTAVDIDQAKRHKQWHAGITYTCQYCNEVSSQLTSHLSHIRTKHTSEFVCDVCGYSFVSDKGLKMHKTRMHKQYREGDEKPRADVKETSLYCAECDIQFGTGEGWKRHRANSARHRDRVG